MNDRHPATAAAQSRLPEFIHGNYPPAPPNPEGQRLLALQQHLAQSQWWSAQRLGRAQAGQLVKLLRHARETVPAYQQRLRDLPIEQLKSSDDPANHPAWRAIPLLERATLQRQGEQFVSARPPVAHGSLHRVATSGSTGMPVQVLGSQLTQRFYLAATLRDHLWHRRDFAASLAAIRPDREATGPEGIRASGWGAAVDTILRAGSSMLLHSSHDSPIQLRWLRRQQPAYLLSLPSILVELARHLDGERLPGLRQVRSYGETLDPARRQAIETGFGVPVVDAYSAQEAGTLALQCPEQPVLHVQAESVLIEVLDDEGDPCPNGVLGRVAVTCLHNFAQPLIRYLIGDYAVKGDSCGCGRGLPVIKQVAGRSRNLLRTSDGRAWFPSFPAEAWDAIPGIHRLQIAQIAFDTLEVRLLGEPLAPVHRDALVAALRQALGDEFRYVVRRVDALPRGNGGKFEDFVSEIPH